MMDLVQTSIDFQDPALARDIARGTADLEGAAFGAIGFDRDGIVRTYNRAEAQAAGLPPARVVGFDLFTAVAPCLNNFMVAHRFETEPELDTVIDYVLTLRMRPTRVRLRLIQTPGSTLRYVLIQRL